MLRHNHEPAYTLSTSVRHLKNLVGYASLYEFEDLIRAINSSRLVEFEDIINIEKSRKIFKATRLLDRSGKIGHWLSRQFIPHGSQFHFDQDYTLFFPTFNNPFELFFLRAMDGWREHCHYAACYINEVWESEFHKCDYLLELLKDFDHVFVGLHHSVESLSKLIGKPCTYLPIGIDALQFDPFNTTISHRSIDVCNIGRRSDLTHQALLKMADQQGLFYYFDTISTPHGVVNAAKQTTFYIKSHQEHRWLLSNLLKRSRYFIVNRAFVNDPARTGGKSEIPSRFFEGSAAGTVMVGDPPDTDIFREYFDWEDAIIPVPFDAPHIADIIAALEAQPERIAAIQRNNAIHALLKHDWLHRLNVVYRTFDLPPSTQMMERSTQITEAVDRIHHLSPTTTLYAA